VTEGLPAEGTDEAADVIRAGVDSVKKSAQNAMVDVRVEYLRALDHSPEEAKRFSKLLDAAKEVDGKKPSASEVVAKHFGITLQTRAEIAKANREKKALVEKAQTALDAATAELETKAEEFDAKVEAGEMTAEEMDEALKEANAAVATAQQELAAASGPAETGKEKSPTEILIDHVKKMEKLSKEVDAKGVEGLDEKQKKATRAKLEAIRDTVKNLLSEI
jgi:DNA repair exonuclease SbcCD ATPase subunit